MSTKKVIKLNEDQLRSIVKAVIKESVSISHIESVDTIANEIGDQWNSSYDPNDPVMSEYGQDKWESQVSRAVQHLSSELERVINETEEALHNGEFALGDDTMIRGSY